MKLQRITRLWWPVAVVGVIMLHGCEKGEDAETTPPPDQRTVPADDAEIGDQESKLLDEYARTLLSLVDWKVAKGTSSHSVARRLRKELDDAFHDLLVGYKPATDITSLVIKMKSATLQRWVTECVRPSGNLSRPECEGLREELKSDAFAIIRDYAKGRNVQIQRKH